MAPHAHKHSPKQEPPRQGREAATGRNVRKCELERPVHGRGLCDVPARLRTASRPIGGLQAVQGELAVKVTAWEMPWEETDPGHFACADCRVANGKSHSLSSDHAQERCATFFGFFPDAEFALRRC